MNNQFPQMLYRSGGTEEIHGAKLATNIVNDADELEQALADGWHPTTPEAIAAGKAPAEGADDDKPATRDELKAKATELGLQFAGNIATVKLAELVEQALADGSKD